MFYSPEHIPQRTFSRISKSLMAILLIVFALLFSCKNQQQNLPYLGEQVEINGKMDYPKIADFRLLSQDSLIITNDTFKSRVYVADFIFLSCPTICPIMTKEMYDVYKVYENDNRVAFVSHTIDPEHDSIPLLKKYAENMDLRSNKWYFLTGNQDSIFNLAEQSYFSTAYADSTAPGGFIHSGGLLLIDKSRYIRGVYNSKNSQETERLIKDIKVLLNE